MPSPNTTKDTLVAVLSAFHRGDIIRLDRWLKHGNGYLCAYHSWRADEETMTPRVAYVCARGELRWSYFAA
jgi:hypothetical protein